MHTHTIGLGVTASPPTSYLCMFEWDVVSEFWAILTLYSVSGAFVVGF